MEKRFVGESEVLKLAVYYFIIKETVDDKTWFGIEVARGDDVLTMREVTRDGNACIALLQTMIKGKVTPLTAQYIVRDWIEEQREKQEENLAISV